MGICDPVAEIPWSCGFEDGCPVGWHLAVYDYDQTTAEPVTSRYNDGDWEGCDEEDIPKQAEIDEAWKSYYEYVARTGLDPLTHFLVDTTRKAKHRWQALFRNWIGSQEYGLLCVGVRRRGRGDWLKLADTPKVVTEFLLLKPTPGQALACCEDMKSFDELTKAENVIDPRIVAQGTGCVFYFDVEEEQPVAPNRVAQTLKRLAREQLRTPA